MNKTYRHPLTGETYIEGSRYVTRLPDGTIFNGVPTSEELASWGFLEYYPSEGKTSADKFPNPYSGRMSEIRKELADMDYLTSKELDGEDMKPYGDYKARRRALRAEYNALEAAGRQIAEQMATTK